MMKKSKTRLFVDKKISQNLIVYIKNKQHHFLKNVLRVKINDQINIFDGYSGEWCSIISSINRDNIVLRVTHKINEFVKSNEIWLIFAPLKQNRMNILIQKATEIGVTKIIPCKTEYTNAKNLNLKNLYLNAVEAAEQSERLDVPDIEKQIDLKSLMNTWPDDRILIYCNEKLKTKKGIIESINEFKKENKKWAILIGPEGGFSEFENELILKNNNVLNVSLGKTILRSDTAAIVALFCLKEIIF
tara:strand:- start:752 stop:1486 length:735 start_codon:yes stop_codon:yes gene_type:complete